MTYVLDTNVVSALRVPGRNPVVQAWADSVPVSLIAAVTQANGKIVVTRNIRHFEPLGVPCLNPWSDR